jgi:hypothetical protein
MAERENLPCNNAVVSSFVKEKSTTHKALHRAAASRSVHDFAVLQAH